jgi:hypothetical protein
MARHVGSRPATVADKTIPPHHARSTVPFETRSAGTLPRYQTAIERQLAKDVAWLERLQAERKVNAVSTSSTDNDPVATGEVSDSQQPEGAIVIDLEPTSSSAQPLGHAQK